MSADRLAPVKRNSVKAVEQLFGVVYRLAGVGDAECYVLFAAVKLSPYDTSAFGIGLSVAQAIAELHKGSITAENVSASASESHTDTTDKQNTNMLMFTVKI